MRLFPSLIVLKTLVIFAESTQQGNWTKSESRDLTQVIQKHETEIVVSPAIVVHLI